MEILFLIVGLAVGAVCAWLIARARIARLETELEGRLVLREELVTTVKALSADLHSDARDDLEARQRAVERMIAPLKESLDKVTTGVQELEKARSASHGALSGEIRGLVEAQARLQAETTNLATALRSPGVRGRWGEIQLRRVVELAGMVSYCDFDEQRTLSVEGRTLRPDLVVRLPGGRNVVIDAKAPFEAYIQASDSADETTRRALLGEHARRLREHVGQLSARAYWEPFEPTTGFVVMFIPAEPLFHSALEHDPGLIEEAARQNVLITSPASLIALLRAVAEGWRQETLAESAREVSLLGKQLYERLSTLASHFTRLRKGLESAVGAYNDAIGSLERSVLVSARRFNELGVPTVKDIVELEPIQQSTRVAQASELTERASLGQANDVADAA